jgi:hypothetical protein
LKTDAFFQRIGASAVLLRVIFVIEREPQNVAYVCPVSKLIASDPTIVGILEFRLLSRQIIVENLGLGKRTPDPALLPFPQLIMDYQ